MDYGLAKIADSMIKTIVTPVVVNWSTTTFHVEEKTKESGHCADSVLRIVSSTDHKVHLSQQHELVKTELLFQSNKICIPHSCRLTVQVVKPCIQLWFKLLNLSMNHCASKMMIGCTVLEDWHGQGCLNWSFQIFCQRFVSMAWLNSLIPKLCFPPCEY